MNLLRQGFVAQADGGPLYCETDFSRFPVEPWATYTEAGFFLVVFYWAWRLRGRWGEHRFLAFALPMLFVGAVGGVLFHAFRNSRVYFLMDVIPLGILILATVGHLFHRVVPNVWLAAGFAAFVFGLNRLVFATVDARVVAIATSYGLSALAMTAPVLVELRRRAWRGWPDIALAVGFVAFGTWLHRNDQTWCETLPMGTLGLWHLCAAIGVHYLIRFLARREVGVHGTAPP